MVAYLFKKKLAWFRQNPQLAYPYSYLSLSSNIAPERSCELLLKHSKKSQQRSRAHCRTNEEISCDRTDSGTRIAMGGMLFWVAPLLLAANSEGQFMPTNQVGQCPKT